MSTTVTLAELPSLAGTELGTSHWYEVTQKAVDAFARATGDRQWIHVDVEHAKARSPFGGPIAHGFFTLSLLVPLARSTYTISDAVLGVNYGLNRVRFPAPVPVGSRVRAKVTLTRVEEVPGGVQNTLDVVVERDGGDKPVCVAEWVNRAYGPDHDVRDITKSHG